MVVASERVSANKGAGTPGIDKVTAADIEARRGWPGCWLYPGGIEVWLFPSGEVRRALIPKSNGKLVLDPIFEYPH